MSITLHPLDWIVIVTYFVGIVILGLWVARRVKDTEHFFLGKRGFSVWLILGQAFGVGTHAEMPVAYPDCKRRRLASMSQPNDN